MPIASPERVLTKLLVSDREYAVDQVIMTSGDPLVTVLVSPIGEMPDATLRDLRLTQEGWSVLKNHEGQVIT
jgi:hypothetical protein